MCNPVVMKFERFVRFSEGKLDSFRFEDENECEV